MTRAATLAMVFVPIAVGCGGDTRTGSTIAHDNLCGNGVVDANEACDTGVAYADKCPGEWGVCRTCVKGCVVELRTHDRQEPPFILLTQDTNGDGKINSELHRKYDVLGNVTEQYWTPHPWPADAKDGECHCVAEAGGFSTICDKLDGSVPNVDAPYDVNQGNMSFDKIRMELWEEEAPMRSLASTPMPK